MATVIYLYNKKRGIWFFIAAILMNISRIVPRYRMEKKYNH